MSIPAVLETAIGLVFVYVVLSMLAIGISELLVVALNMRSGTLVRGLEELLDDERTGLVRKICNDRLIKGLKEGGEWKRKRPTGLPAEGKQWWPASIPKSNFARALINAVAEDDFGRQRTLVESEAREEADGDTDAEKDAAAERAVETLRQTWSVGEGFIRQVKSGSNPFLSSLRPLVEEAGTDLQKVREKLETWFDQSTESLTRFYRSQSKAVALVIGIVLAIALNADTFHMAHTFWTDPAVRAQLVEAAEQAAADSTLVESLAAADVGEVEPPAGEAGAAEGGDESAKAPADSLAKIRAIAAWKEFLERANTLDLPFGWKERPFAGLGWRGVVARIAGWLVTGAAVSLGAPFWYDLLQRLVGIRATMRRKEDKQEQQDS